jgi:hypothetical protein
MLEHFFGSKTRVKLLSLFFREPERSFYVRELARLIEIQLNAVRRELMNLERFGIIRPVAKSSFQDGQKQSKDRSKYYALYKDHLLYAELQAFLAKAELLEKKVFIDQVLSGAGDVKLFVLTGFFIPALVGSPTDILLVGTLQGPAIDLAIGQFEAALGRPIRYTLMDGAEFKERYALGDIFLRSILEQQHITLIDRTK